MSQFSSQAASSSQAHSNESSLHYHRCWWAWCRHSFYTRKELADHVNLEHVQRARPVRLADMPILQKNEDGYWDSLEIPGLSDWSLQTFQDRNHHEANPLDHIPSSLPSPPASTPHDTPGTPVSAQSCDDCPVETEEPQKSSHYLVSPQTFNGLLTPMSKRVRPDSGSPTPTFALLSSELNSPDQDTHLVPESPCFDSLVAAATKRHLPVLSQSPDAREVLSDESSQEFVFNQLTQGLDVEEDKNELDLESKTRRGSMVIGSSPAQPIPQSISTIVPDRPDLNQLSLTPLQVQTHQLDYTPRALTTSPSHLQSPTFPLPIPARQSWYQPRRRRSSRKTSNSEAQDAQSSPVTSPAAHTGTLATSPVSVRFDTVPIQAMRPSLFTAPRSPSHPQEPPSQNPQTDSSQASSYPPIQTQAPYRSPSFSQSWQD